VLKATRVNQDRRDCKAQAAFPSLAQLDQLVLKARRQQLQDLQEQLDQPEQLGNHLRDHKATREQKVTPGSAAAPEQLAHLGNLLLATPDQQERRAALAQLDP
jgi:hypothetical protein